MVRDRQRPGDRRLRPTMVDREPNSRHRNGWCTGSRTMERSRIGSSLTLQTGIARAEQADASLSCSALALPVPAILFAIDLFIVIEIDRTQSYPAAVTCPAERVQGPRLMAVFALSVGPGRHGLAAESRVRPARSASRSPGWSLCSSSGCPPTWAFGSIVAGRSGSPVRIATLRLPATVWPARSAEHASRILPRKESRSSPEAMAENLEVTSVIDTRSLIRR